jgi:hypothetical protein
MVTNDERPAPRGAQPAASTVPDRSQDTALASRVLDLVIAAKTCPAPLQVEDEQNGGDGEKHERGRGHGLLL